jgi:hypothetical protein
MPLVCMAIVTACGKSEPASTPLPTKDKTIGRVQDSLQKADDDAAKQRRQIEDSVK